jgi:anti-sigma factor (TIGR02949 family)
VSNGGHTGQPDEIGCLEAIESLYAYLDGELHDSAAVARVEQHLGHCRSCFSRAEFERALTTRLRESAGSSAPKTLQARLRKIIDEF